MSITFTLRSAAQKPSPVATINARQLAAFRSLLRIEGARLRTPLLDPDRDEGEPLAYNFEARVCPIALAVVTATFDHDPEVIGVVEEAQFQGKRVLVWRDPATGSIKMRVSILSDAGLDVDLPNGMAFALLEGLGIEPASTGTLALSQLLNLLADQSIRTALEAHGLGWHADQIELLARSAREGEEETLLSWA